MTKTAAKPAPINVGESRDFPAGRVTISVTRTAIDAYRVLVLELSGHAITCWTSEFTPERIPADVTVRRAAWDYIQLLTAEFGASLETPAAVAGRVRIAA